MSRTSQPQPVQKYMASSKQDSISNLTQYVSDQYDQASLEADLSLVRQSVISSLTDKAEILFKKEWLYVGDKYAFAGFLVNQRIALYWVKGHVKKKDSQHVLKIMQEVISSSKEEKLCHILDLSCIRSFSLSARKAYEEINNALSPHWKNSYYIFSSLGTTVFKIYTAVNPSFSKEVILADSIAHAIRLCQENGSPQENSQQQTFAPHSASREELLEQYLQLKHQHQRLAVDHQQKANQLLEIIARTSWDENFEKADVIVSPSDPFFNTFSALSLLKQDLGEIYERQKQANRILEAEVARRTRQLSSVIENTSDMIISVDRSWTVQVVNTAFQQHFKSFNGSDIATGDHLLSLYPDEDSRYFWQSRFERAFEGHGFCEQLSAIVGGQKIYFDLTFNAIRKAEQEEISEVSVFGRDITNLRQTEERASETAKNLTRALKIAKAGSWEFHLDTQQVIIGKEGLEVIGYMDREELRLSMDEFIQKLLHPDDQLLLQERVQYAINKREDPDFQDQFQYRLLHRDGRVLHLMLYSRFKSNERGIIYGITQDISQQKEAEEKLLLQNAALRKVNGELDQFVYSVSHDLRAPLASVLGLINISRQEDQRETLMHYLDLQEKSIHKLDTYIREIIDLSKNARLNIQKEAVDFTQLVEEVFQGQHYDQSAATVQKINRIEQPFPFCSDHKRIRVILQNLVSNALRYANLQQEPPFVRVSVVVEASQTVLEVEDNGVGIHADYLPNIFQMFYRANHHKTGSGLGLYIVKETLEKLEGRIKVHSEVGKGSKFTVIIPNMDT